MARSKPKVPMPASVRAKQFAPFSALKGLDEAIAAKERIVIHSITSPAAWVAFAVHPGISFASAPPLW